MTGLRSVFSFEILHPYHSSVSGQQGSQRRPGLVSGCLAGGEGPESGSGAAVVAAAAPPAIGALPSP